jgi:hypothetical protein
MLTFLVLESLFFYCYPCKNLNINELEEIVFSLVPSPYMGLRSMLSGSLLSWRLSGQVSPALSQVATLEHLSLSFITN